MSKFIFKLQSLLNIKEKLEEQNKIEYGKALAALEEEKSKLINLETKKNDNILNFRESIKKGIKSEYIKNINYFIVYIDKKIEEQLCNIEKAENFVEEKRLILLNSMKEKKVLETLKDKEKEIYLKEVMKEEQKNVDEIVSYKYNKA